MTIFYSRSDNGRHEYGVGFILKEPLVKLVKKFEAIDDRLCYLIIKGKTSNIAIINCYAPTETADNDSKDSFYDNLERVYDMIPRNCIRILVGTRMPKLDVNKPLYILQEKKVCIVKAILTD